MWPVTIATTARVSPPTNGIRWAMKEPSPVTRLTTAIVLLGRLAAMAAGVATGTVLDGADCWPVTWVAGDVAGGCGSSFEGVLTAVSLPLIQWRFRRRKLSKDGSKPSPTYQAFTCSATRRR